MRIVIYFDWEVMINLIDCSEMSGMARLVQYMLEVK
jgi:hypothetical protein